MTQDTQQNEDTALPTWQPRRYRPGDEVELEALFGVVFDRQVTPEWWLWKMRGEAEACKNVWVGESAGGHLMAQYAGIPVAVQIDGKKVSAMVSVDTMTAPDFRKRGVLSTLGKLAYDDWAAQGKVAVLGLPNQQWGSRTTALGWEQLFPLAWLRFPLHVETAVARSHRIPAPLRLLTATGVAPVVLIWHKIRQANLSRRSNGIMVTDIGRDLTLIDSIWELLSPRYRNTLVRDGAWVKWRFLEAVDADYNVLVAHKGEQPIGYIAYRIADAEMHTTGLIADLFVAPDDVETANALLHGALADMWQAGAVTARTTASPGGNMYRLLVAAGFTPLEASFSFDMVLLDLSLKAETLSDPHDWHLAGGDFDIV